MLKIFKPLDREPFSMEEIEEFMTMTEAYECGISKFFKETVDTVAVTTDEDEPEVVKEKVEVE